MSKSKNIFIKQLDFGYVMVVDGKERAIESDAGLHSSLAEHFKSITDKASQKGINNFTVYIEVDENVPQAINEGIK